MAATISIIAARAKNGIIGAQNKLPWHLPEDLKNFKLLTFGHPVIMGRKTHDSIGKPLPGRMNIVISRNLELQIAGCSVLHSLQSAVAMARANDDNEIFIIGGAQIYAEAMHIAARLYLTEINQTANGDAFFPQFSKSEWKEKERRPGESSAAKCQFAFVIYERK